APSGDLYITKPLVGTLDIGCGPVSSGAAQATLVARLDPSGACIWSKALDASSPAAFTLGADGSVLLAFIYTGTIDLGGGPRTAGGVHSLAVVKLDAGGAHVFDASFGGAGADFFNARIDAAPSGIVLLSGSYQGIVDLGGGPLDAAMGER